jgi:hypothetical protein
MNKDIFEIESRPVCKNVSEHSNAFSGRADKLDGSSHQSKLTQVHKMTTYRLIRLALCLIRELDPSLDMRHATLNHNFFYLCLAEA